MLTSLNLGLSLKGAKRYISIAYHNYQLHVNCNQTIIIKVDFNRRWF